MEAVKKKDAWAWWNEALAGRVGAMHEGQPEQGYYRTRVKNGPWEPVAIWVGDDGSWLAMRGPAMVDPADTWNFCRTHPVTYEAYTKAMDGEGWDDEPAAPAIGHNVPSDPFEALKQEFESEKEMVDSFLKKPITTQAEADKSAIWAKRLSTISTKATQLHKVEKQPALDEGRRVDGKWRDLKEEPDLLSKKLKRHLDAFLQEEARKERERQAAARAEAERVAAAAEEARLAAEKSAEAQEEAGMHDIAAVAAHNNAIAEAERLAEQSAQAERDAEARKTTAGRTGARVSLRTFTYAEIVDFDKVLMALKDRPEIIEVVATLANRAARSGVELAGMAIRSEQRAA